MPTSQAIPINMCTPQDIAKKLFDPRVIEILQAVDKHFAAINFSNLLPQGVYSDEHRKIMTRAISCLLGLMVHKTAPIAAISAKDYDLPYFMELETLGLFRTLPIYDLRRTQPKEVGDILKGPEYVLDSHWFIPTAQLLDRLEKQISAPDGPPTGRPAQSVGHCIIPKFRDHVPLD